MANVIQKHTEDLRRERLANSRIQKGPTHFGHSGNPLRKQFRIGTETSALTNAYSDMEGYVRTARMQGQNTGFDAGGWRVSKRVPSKPYEPFLKDVYPRNEYTMMPAQHGPKYFSGHFLTFDYKDAPQAPANTVDTGRPVVFKTQAIDRVQTKKKYGNNLKGESSVPLHLCNDTSSLLYQRSLMPNTMREKRDLESRDTSAISDLRSTVSRYPFAIHHGPKGNDSSATNPLMSSMSTQNWINTSYPTGRRGRDRVRTSGSSSVFGVSNRTVNLDGRDLRSGRIQSAPEWYSEFFPRQKVADALKFMGSPKSVNQPSDKQEFDINFNAIK